MPRIYQSIFASPSTEAHMKIIFFLSFFSLIRFPNLLSKETNCFLIVAIHPRQHLILTLPQNIPDTSYFFFLPLVAVKIWSKFSLLFPTCRKQNKADKIHKHLQDKVISFQQQLEHHSHRTKGYQAGYKGETPLSTR